MDWIISLYVLLIGAVFVYLHFSSKKRREKMDAERPALERRERIKFLWYVASMPTDTRCDRTKACRELEKLLEEGF